MSDMGHVQCVPEDQLTELMQAVGSLSNLQELSLGSLFYITKKRPGVDDRLNF
jgi:hypothetical protein